MADNNDFDAQQQKFVNSMRLLNNSINRLSRNIEKINVNEEEGTVSVRKYGVQKSQYKTSSKKKPESSVSQKSDLKSINKSVDEFSRKINKFDEDVTELNDTFDTFNEGTKRFQRSINEFGKIGNKFIRSFDTSVRTFKATIHSAPARGLMRTTKGALGVGFGAGRLAASPFTGAAKAGWSVTGGAAMNGARELSGQGRDQWSNYKSSQGKALAMGLLGGPVASPIIAGLLGSMFGSAKGGAKMLGRGARGLAGGTKDVTLAGFGALQGEMRNFLNWAQDYSGKNQYNFSDNNAKSLERDIKRNADKGIYRLSSSGEILGPSDKLKLKKSKKGGQVIISLGMEESSDGKVKDYFKKSGGVFGSALGNIFGVRPIIGYAIPFFGMGYRSELPNIKREGAIPAIAKTLALSYVHQRFASQELNDLILQQSRLLQEGFGLQGSLRRPKARSMSELIGGKLRGALSKVFSDPFNYAKERASNKLSGAGNWAKGKMDGAGGLISQVMGPGYQKWKKGRKTVEGDIAQTPSMGTQLQVLFDMRHLLTNILIQLGGKPPKLSKGIRPKGPSRGGAPGIVPQNMPASANISPMFDPEIIKSAKERWKKFRSGFGKKKNPAPADSIGTINPPQAEETSGTSSGNRPGIMGKIGAFFGLDKIVAFLKGIHDNIKTAAGLNDSVEGIPILEKVFKYIGAIPSTIGNTVENVWNWMRKKLNKEIDAKTATLSDRFIVNVYQKLVPDVIKKIVMGEEGSEEHKGLISPIKGILTGVLTGLLSVPRAMIKLTDSFYSYVVRVIEPMREAFNDKENVTIMDKFKSSIKAIPDTVLSVFTELGTLGKDLWITAKVIGSGIGALFGVVFGEGLKAQLDLFIAGRDIKKELAKKLLSTHFSGLFSRSMDLALEYSFLTFEMAAGLIMGTMKKNSEDKYVFTAASEKAGGGVKGFVSGLMASMSAGFEEGMIPFKNFVSSLKTALIDLKNVIRDDYFQGKGIKGTGSAVKGFWGDITETIKNTKDSLMIIAGLLKEVVGFALTNPNKNRTTKARGGVVPGRSGEAVNIVAHGGEVFMPMKKFDNGGTLFVPTHNANFEDLYVKPMTSRLDVIIGYMKDIVEHRKTYTKMGKEKGFMRRMIEEGIIMAFKATGHFGIGAIKITLSAINLGIKTVGHSIKHILSTGFKVLDAGLESIRLTIKTIRVGIDAAWMGIKGALYGIKNIIVAPFKKLFSFLTSPYEWFKKAKEKIKQKADGIVNKIRGRSVVAGSDEKNVIYDTWPNVMIKHLRSIDNNVSYLKKHAAGETLNQEFEKLRNKREKSGTKEPGVLKRVSDGIIGAALGALGIEKDGNLSVTEAFLGYEFAKKTKGMIGKLFPKLAKSKVGTIVSQLLGRGGAKAGGKLAAKGALSKIPYVGTALTAVFAASDFMSARGKSEEWLGEGRNSTSDKMISGGAAAVTSVIDTLTWGMGPRAKTDDLARSGSFFENEMSVGDKLKTLFGVTPIGYGLNKLGIGDNLKADKGSMQLGKDAINRNSKSIIKDQSYDDKLKGMIGLHEGYRNNKYNDSRGFPTIGIGHKLLPGENYDNLTDAEVSELFQKDLAKHRKEAESIPGFLDLDPARQAALIDMTFNMGVGKEAVGDKKGTGVKGFTKMLAAMKNKDWDTASKEILNSPYAKQTGSRAQRTAALMKTGDMGIVEDAAAKLHGQRSNKVLNSGTLKDSEIVGENKDNTFTSGSIVWPPANGRLTSKYGPRNTGIAGASKDHKGIDIGPPVPGAIGEPIKAVMGGEVKFTGPLGGYGNLVTISHPDGTETRYGHLSSISVAKGQQVSAGDVIGQMGNTGLAGMKPHLHFEIRKGKDLNSKSSAVDPESYFGALPSNKQQVAAGQLSPSASTPSTPGLVARETMPKDGTGPDSQQLASLQTENTVAQANITGNATGGIVGEKVDSMNKASAKNMAKLGEKLQLVIAPSTNSTNTTVANNTGGNQNANDPFFDPELGAILTGNM